MTSNVARASHANTSTLTPSLVEAFSSRKAPPPSDLTAFDPVNDEKGLGIQREMPVATASFAKLATGENGSAGVEALLEESMIPNQRSRS